VPWLERDVNDHLEALAEAGASGVVLAPIGFVSDHMDVVYDLDTEATRTAAKLGLAVARAATPGTDERFVAAMCNLVVERAAVARGEHPDRPSTGRLGPGWEVCPADCCPPLKRRTVQA